MELSAIRPATIEDAPRLAEIYSYYVRETAVSFDEHPPTADQMAHHIQEVLSRLPWLVFDDGEVRGYAYAVQHRDRASYRWSVNVSVYLHRDSVGQGIGRQLYLRLFEILRSLGYRRALAGITLPNEASVGLHRAMGFEDVGTYRNVGYKFNEWHDTFWMQKELLPPVETPWEPRLFPELAE
jgi:L-amino acid N-acyltransferase YncA